ncbi:Protein Hook-like 1 [Hondaea fermentalgiana]|uniref:Protein Hook-like 1 n=1 Tax=Hondaea fermentalgiana TaxID=2315210 RepID=A0A2R5GNI6_9STRA|nr:Protein Hook-like 1 [Hondaea fermentalgiana]|eukprot:GBG32456.1 Protein Hook-like 1 [Hondaea fermentalgiana]
MASSAETLLRWLNSLIEANADMPTLRSLEEILDPENASFREIVGEITNVHGASESPAELLERYFRNEGQPYMIDRGSALSLSKAALGAAVNCDRKQEYVRDMMTLNQDFQATLMILIEEFKREWDEGEATQLKAIVKRLERENAVLREAHADGATRQAGQHQSRDTGSSGAAASSGTTVPARSSSGGEGQGNSASSTSAVEVATLNDKVRDLERRLRDALNHVDEVETELEESKQEHASMTRALEEKVAQYEEEVRTQADELDVARAKSSQLVKAEAKISKLMQKLEETSQLRMQIKELQDENQTSLDKQLRMDAEIKSVSTLKQQLETYKDKSVDLESQLVGLRNEMRTKDETIASVQSKLKAAADHESFLKDQLNSSKEAIAQLEAELDLAGTAGAGASSPGTGDQGVSADASLAHQVQAHSQQTATASMKLENAELKEKLTALEKASAQLEEELERATTQAAANASQGASHEVVEQLKTALKEKESECLQLATDKEKLQTYVKQSLHATQSKYKVALKTLKSELDEKTERIENFRKIRDEDNALHLREQRLVMSAFYDMGLSIQRNTALKSTAQGSWLAKSRKQL